MKTFIFIALFVTFNIYSQDITGTWKVISYEDEIVYYHKSKDSIVYKDISRKDEAENFKAMSEISIFPITYEFLKDGKYNMNHPIEKISGKYIVDAQNKKIIFIENVEEDALPFLLLNKILFLEMEMEEGYIKIGLERI